MGNDSVLKCAYIRAQFFHWNGSIFILENHISTDDQFSVSFNAAWKVVPMRVVKVLKMFLATLSAHNR